MKEEKDKKPKTTTKKQEKPKTTAKKKSTTTKKTTTKAPVKKTQTVKKVESSKPKAEKIPKTLKTETTLKEESIVKNSLFPILLFSFLTSIIAIFLAYSQSKAANSYIFSGFNDYIAINSGLISRNNKVNSFEGNNISFKGEEDLLVTYYEFGYYIKEKDFKTKIISSEKNFKSPASLKNEINSIIGFNFVENSNNKDTKLDDEALDLIEQGKLFFFVDYKTEKSDQLIENIELQLKVLKN